MKRYVVMIAAVMMGLFLAPLQSEAAQGPKPHKKQMHQHQRIKHGVRHGEITRGEAMHLRQQQMRINDLKAMAAADGRITRKERAIINYEQQKASAHIYNAKHNGRRR